MAARSTRKILSVGDDRSVRIVTALQTHVTEESAKVEQGDPAVDLQQSAFDEACSSSTVLRTPDRLSFIR